MQTGASCTSVVVVVCVSALDQRPTSRLHKVLLQKKRECLLCILWLMQLMQACSAWLLLLCFAWQGVARKAQNGSANFRVTMSWWPVA